MTCMLLSRLSHCFFCAGARPARSGHSVLSKRQTPPTTGPVGHVGAEEEHEGYEEEADLAQRGEDEEEEEE